MTPSILGPLQRLEAWNIDVMVEFAAKDLEGPQYTSVCRCYTRSLRKEAGRRKRSLERKEHSPANLRGRGSGTSGRTEYFLLSLTVVVCR